MLARPSTARPFTRRPTLSVEEAAEWIGISRTLAYELARADRLPCAVIRAGHRLAVPTRHLMRVLGADEQHLELSIRLAIDVAEAAALVDISLTHAYGLARTNELPSAVLRVGHRLIVPTWPLMAVLGIESTELLK
ncbi:MAG: hypothetical protein R2705_15270 [Ilumatobacteraceae bacterium]